MIEKVPAALLGMLGLISLITYDLVGTAII